MWRDYPGQRLAPGSDAAKADQRKTAVPSLTALSSGEAAIQLPAVDRPFQAELSQLRLAARAVSPTGT